ncbi:MAG: [FeFe] hydrogenase, group A [Actinomycetia bacterium]|nr:[FeFe] hydrogenase, group A [Actinomycetes bacterium]
MVKQVQVTIDDRTTTVPETMTILAAAQTLDIKIPTLCFYWGINEVGACRICAVEVEGSDQLVAACNNRVTDCMIVHTNTAKVRAVRRLNMELILSRHDVQCTSCVRGGNCELRQLANDLNIIDQRFGYQPESFDWNIDIPLIRDAGKCIKCMRCINVCDQMQACNIWDLKNRATRTTVGVRGQIYLENSLCTLCGQCIVHCPTGALRERDDVDQALAAIEDPEIVTVIQVAPSARTSWGEQLGLSREQASVKRLVATLKRLGFDYVFDTDFSADLTIVEEASEFVQRFTHHDDFNWPMFTSCCSGWWRWLKGHYPDMVDNLSTAKSPQGMLGPMAKTYFAEKIGVDPSKIRCISLMPCLAKKQEAATGVLRDAGYGPDVDLVLTVRELDRLIKSEFLDCAKLPEVDFDDPMGIGSGSGELFGVSGGVMEAALRSAYFYVTGSNPDPKAFANVRGLEGWKEAQFDIPGAGTVQVAVASGLANAEKLIQAIRSGAARYDFVEIMACPGGCVNGGGQPISQNAATTMQRTQVIYGLDQRNQYRFSHGNPAIQQIYREFLGAPLSEKSHRLLHTDQHAWGMPDGMPSADAQYDEG